MENTNTNYCPAVLSDGKGGWTPCPELLTEEETIRYLRLDEGGSPDPIQTLTYYRNTGTLIAIKVGKVNRYRRKDLDAFLEKKSTLKKDKLII